ncbi:MAG TPA: ABC transporter permease [Planctomycetaceae bacterium]|nr:ABC transporter permease [Planctomycetaceae bacterium]
MGGALEITRKDLKLLVRDRRALVLLLLLPMGFIAILGMSTGQLFTGGDKQQYTIGFVDHDNSETSSMLLAQYQQHQEIKVLPINSDSRAAEMLRKNEVAAVVTVGPEFEEHVQNDLTVDDLFGSEDTDYTERMKALDVTMDIKSTVAEGGLTKYFLISELYQSIFPVVAQGNNFLRRRALEILEARKAPKPVAVAAAAPQKEPNKVYQFLVPGFTVMFVFFLINIMARSFIAERDIGTLRRLRLAPIAPVSVLIGKTLPFYICSVVQTAALFLSGRLLFDMPWGPEPAYLIPVILCTSAAATALGLMLATWVKTDQQVSAYGTSMVLILGGISGCFIPRMWLPALMKKLSLATPHAWALQAFESVLTVDVIDVTVIVTYCAVLLGFATAFFSIGWWRFRTEMG